MPQQPLALTISAAITPPLDPDTAQAIGDELAARAGGTLVVVDSDHHHVTSWRLHIPATDTQLSTHLADLEANLRAAVPADRAVTPTALEALTADEVDARLARHGVPPRGQVCARPRPDLGPIPQVVNTAEFAEILGVTPARIRQLRDEHAAGKAPSFPEEVLPGHWLLGQAADYARIHAVERPKGRPRRKGTPQ